MVFTKIPAQEVKVGTKILGDFYPREIKTVVEIYARGIDRHGKPYVCGYHDTGTGTGKCSFSYSDSEPYYSFENSDPEVKQIDIRDGKLLIKVPISEDEYVTKSFDIGLTAQASLLAQLADIFNVSTISN